MITTNHDDRLGIAQALATATALTPEQAQALADECAKPEYQGMTRAELLIALNQGQRNVPNPQARQRVPRTALRHRELTRGMIDLDALEREGAGLPLNEYGELALFMSTARTAARNWPGTAEEKAARVGFMDLVDRDAAGLFEYNQIDLTNPLVAQPLQLAVSLGLVSQAQYDRLTTHPDPAWEPYVNVPAPVEALFGPGAYVESSDLDAAGVEAP